MRERLRELSRSPDAGWWGHDRVEMVLLAAEGWSAPLIAQHLGCSDKTVRRVLAAFRSTGVDALDRKLRGPAPDFTRQQQVHAALGALLEQQRTWTSGQLARALQNHGVHVGPRQVRRYLASMGARWRHVLDLLERLPSPRRPCVVVLGNVGIHVSRQVQQALPRLAKRGLTLFYLPAYSPELNDVKAIFQVPSAQALRAARA